MPEGMSRPHPAVERIIRGEKNKTELEREEEKKEKLVIRKLFFLLIAKLKEIRFVRALIRYLARKRRL